LERELNVSGGFTGTGTTRLLLRLELGKRGKGIKFRGKKKILW